MAFLTTKANTFSRLHAGPHELSAGGDLIKVIIEQSSSDEPMPKKSRGKKETLLRQRAATMATHFTQVTALMNDLISEVSTGAEPQ